MQHHIGTDIIEIERVKEAIERYGERFLKSVYTPDELKLYGERAHSLAASFAAKEAVMKVLGTGNRGVAWREIEVLHHETGKPYIRLHRRALEEAGKLGLEEIDVSMSHSRAYATATAIGASRPRQP
jgi:holo-[acyl-carrier protein] synthase